MNVKISFTIGWSKHTRTTNVWGISKINGKPRNDSGTSDPRFFEFEILSNTTHSRISPSIVQFLMSVLSVPHYRLTIALLEQSERESRVASNSFLTGQEAQTQTSVASVIIWSVMKYRDSKYIRQPRAISSSVSPKVPICKLQTKGWFYDQIRRKEEG